MRWRALFTETSGLDRVDEQLIEMLRLDQQSFHLANQALFDGEDLGRLREEVSETDHEVNELVQQIRRELVVHASVGQSAADVPALLTYMSIVKDIERIGDYAKNILDIARARGERSGDDLGDLVAPRELVGRLLNDAIAAFGARDAERAGDLIEQTRPVLRELDERIDEMTLTDLPGHHAVPRALYHRYLKRIAAHLLNVLTAVTSPLDQLDFYRGADMDEED